MAQLLDGKACAKAVRAQIKAEVRRLREASGVQPQVVFIQVGEIPASTTYVNAKSEMARRVGMLSTIEQLPESTAQLELLCLLGELNERPDVHGILVQLPLPPRIDPLAVALAIAPGKDVDCFNPVNVGRVAIGLDGPRPATPQGIMMLLDHYGIDLAGRECVVVGRSNLVGKPLGWLLLTRDATVTYCHSKTADLAVHTRRADVLIAAAGRANLIDGSMLKRGAVVVDVGTNYVAAEQVVAVRGQRDSHEGVDLTETQPGLKLVGDVDFASAEGVASWISPVPGGVGPMTIASVLYNGLQLYRSAIGATS